MPETPGLRDRKKAERRRAIADAARRLVVERGVDGFTVEDVAELAKVSPRTFFNYFDSKEDAVVGIDPQRILVIVATFHARPASESPVLALRNTLVDSVDDIEATAAGFAVRTELVHRHPELLGRHLAGTHLLEQALSAAMAERLQVDPAADPYPTLVVSAAVATLRSCILWWHANGRPRPLAATLDEAFAELERGLPDARRPRPAPGVPIRGVRLACGVAQGDVADAMGVTKSSVAQLEGRDLDTVRFGTLARYFRALGYEVRIELDRVAGPKV